MSHSSKLVMLLLVGMVVVTTGCASSKNQKQINALNAQMGIVTDELIRLDEGLQDARNASQSPTAPSVGSKTATTITGGPLYRTPSGFEVPSYNIQQALKNAGYYTGKIDGKIGSQTKTAVRSFQKDHGLNSDGVVGQNTWDKLKVYLGGAVK